MGTVRGVCGRAAEHYGEAMEAAQHGRSRTVIAIVLGLVVFPLCAVPLYAIGHIADDFDSDGGFALGQALGVVVPAVAAAWRAFGPRGGGRLPCCWGSHVGSFAGRCCLLRLSSLQSSSTEDTSDGRAEASARLDLNPGSTHFP
jgi:hypothetical protein